MALQLRVRENVTVEWALQFKARFSALVSGDSVGWVVDGRQL